MPLEKSPALYSHTLVDYHQILKTATEKMAEEIAIIIDDGPAPKTRRIEEGKETAIPQLNEDVLGRILKFVVERKQRKIWEIVEAEECGKIKGGTRVEDEYSTKDKQYQDKAYNEIVGLQNVKLGCYQFQK